MTEPDEGGRGFFGGMADEAERFVRIRIERLTRLAQERGDALADSVGERFSRHLVDELSQRFAARLTLAGVAVGSLVVGVGLLAVGMAGALGEAFGRPWLGQLAAGGILLAAIAAAWGIGRLRARRAEAARRSAAQGGGPASSSSAPRAPDADENSSHAADITSSETVTAGVELLRRHPLAGAAAVSVAALVAGALVARSNGRSAQQE